MSDVKAKYRGGDWKARAFTKGLRASRTPGNKKGLIPPAWARNMCRRNRSYKEELYSLWCEKCDGGKIKWTGSK